MSDLQPPRRYAYGYQARPAVVERDKLVAKPHMMPGLTKEMLMGARAPVARSKP